MNKLYKLQNGGLIKPDYIGTRHTGEAVTGYCYLEKYKLQQDGWKELEIEPKPYDEKEYEYYHEETKTKIIRKWREKEISDDTEI